MIYQSLDDLKAACLDAIDGETQIKDFEVGVFCGKYQTDVPESYFEHISEIRAKGKKRKNVEEEGSDAKKLTLVSNSGPVNVRKVQEEEEDKPVIDQDDIRYVCRWSLRDTLIDISAAFTTLRPSGRRRKCEFAEASRLGMPPFQVSKVLQTTRDTTREGRHGIWSPG